MRGRSVLSCLIALTVATAVAGLTVVAPAARAASLPCDTYTDVALGKTATASSATSAQPPAKAVDGDTTTRWVSAISDPQWLQVDLGSTQAVCQVAVNW